MGHLDQRPRKKSKERIKPSHPRNDRTNLDRKDISGQTAYIFYLKPFYHNRIRLVIRKTKQQLTPYTSETRPTSPFRLIKSKEIPIFLFTIESNPRAAMNFPLVSYNKKAYIHNKRLRDPCHTSNYVRNIPKEH